MKGRKLSDRDLERHEAKRDVWREVLDGIDEIKAGGAKRYVVAPKTVQRSGGVSNAIATDFQGTSCLFCRTNGFLAGDACFFPEALQLYPSSLVGYAAVYPPCY